MENPQDDFVREKTRRIVARSALRRTSAIIQGWRTEEQENAQLAKRLAISLLIVALVATALFIHY